MIMVNLFHREKAMKALLERSCHRVATDEN
jgi:hypothetical protein